MVKKGDNNIVVSCRTSVVFHLPGLVETSSLFYDLLPAVVLDARLMRNDCLLEAETLRKFEMTGLTFGPDACNAPV